MSSNWKHNKQCGGNRPIGQGQWTMTNCRLRIARRIQIVLPKNDYLTLCEVRITAALTPKYVRGSKKCMRNLCKCRNGRAVTGGACLRPNMYKCASCHRGFRQ